MPYLAMLAVAISLAIYLLPVLLLQRKRYARAQDYFIASSSTPPAVFQNASIAYALQMATFGPFFVWGASGDFKPAIVNSFFFGAGLFLVYVLRHSLFKFLGSSLATDTSITVHEFIARQHGKKAYVRVFASALTIFALLGLVLGEVLGVAALLKSVFLQNVDATYTFIFGMLMLMFLYTIISGNSGVMRSDQAQMGVAYLALFGTTIILFSSLMPNQALDGRVAIASCFVAIFPLAMLLYRRGRFIDFSRLPRSSAEASSPGGGPDVQLVGLSAFRLFEIVLNVVLILAAITVSLYAFFIVWAFGARETFLAGLSALAAPSKLSYMGFAALILLPLLYQVVDITNWQRIAALVKDDATGVDRFFKRVFRIYAVESPLAWLYMCAFGGLGAVALSVSGDEGAFTNFASAIIKGQSPILGGLFLIAVFAIGLSTMSAVFSATLCAIRYDILPFFASPEPANVPYEIVEKGLIQKTVAAGIVFYVLVASAFYVVDSQLQIKFGSNEFLAILFAFYCAQLSFVPLILGPLRGSDAGRFGTVSAPWAIAVLAIGTVAGIACQVVYLVTGDDTWLWGSVPLCLILSWGTFLLARMIGSSGQVA